MNLIRIVMEANPRLIRQIKFPYTANSIQLYGSRPRRRSCVSETSVEPDPWISNLGTTARTRAPVLGTGQVEQVLQSTTCRSAKLVFCPDLGWEQRPARFSSTWPQQASKLRRNFNLMKARPRISRMRSPRVCLSRVSDSFEHS